VRNGCRAVAPKARKRAFMGSMKYVYILQSEVEPERHYVGSTNDLKRRFKEHNDGKSIHTNKHRPWKLKLYVAFSDERKADEFEAFLKTGNGRAFTKKRF
jgi:putative endonuclease